MDTDFTGDDTAVHYYTKWGELSVILIILFKFPINVQNAKVHVNMIHMTLLIFVYEPTYLY